MRQTVNLNSDWVFTKTKSDIKSDLEHLEKVTLPHTYNGIDGQDGGGDYYRGTCYYARRLKKSALPDAQRYYLEFKGANSSASVYIDGRLASHHDGGYSTWRVNVTDMLSDESLICVEVSNEANDRVYPQMADFTFYGGLYRDVRLICVGASHFDLDFYGSAGLMLTPKVKNGRAEVFARVFVTDKKDGQTLRYTALDKEGRVVYQSVCKGETVDFCIENAHLWNGRSDPYLYTFTAELLDGERVLDNVSARFGCRSFEIDAERGFILNGREYPLRGVSRHQDRARIGNALLPEHHREDVELICELGATAVRLAHYQHDQYFLELCDERGLVVWAEIPYISKRLLNGRENIVTQLKELVIQNYNHPSIVVWGLSNEISIGGSDKELLEDHRILNELCHSMDKTRPTAVAAVSMCKPSEPYLAVPDAVAYNHYFGWYGGDTDMNGPWFDEFHEKYPSVPIACSEYGCEGLDYHSSEPSQGDYSEEYQAYYHEELIKQLFKRRYIWATFVWNMFDFGSDARNEGGENGINHKGLVTIDRAYKKDAFYAYKAWLSDEPFVHICSKRYVDRAEDVTRVKVYSNLPRVELFANGVLVGAREEKEHFFNFDVKNVGTTVLEAKAGECSDRALIRKSEVPNESYRLVEGTDVLNWFEIEAPRGCFSLNDKIGEVLGTKEGKLLLAPLKERLLADKKGAMGFELSEDSLGILGGFTVLRLIRLAGAMTGAKLTKNELFSLNARLNQIKKPK